MKNLSKEILEKRKRLGLTQLEFARLLDLNDNGERTVRRWELGEHLPSENKLKQIRNLKENAPFRSQYKKGDLKFIDLFAGIGGMRIGFNSFGKCVFTSEWDKFCQRTYAANFGEVPYGDITKIEKDNIPDHDILLAGFPCQPFSQAGLGMGFHDVRGTLFFEIEEILLHKRPKMFLLENVKRLKSHENGETLNTILSALRGGSNSVSIKKKELNRETQQSLGTLNYWCDYRILNSKDFGLPQNRQRIFIVGFNKDFYGDIDFDYAFKWPEPKNKKTLIGNILENDKVIDPKYTISKKLLDGHKRRLREHKKKGNGFGYSVFKSDNSYTNTISARYYKDGSEILIDQTHLNKRPRKLTPKECARLQGFPEKFIIDAVSDNQIYKQFGNSVSVPVIRSISKSMKKCHEEAIENRKKKSSDIQHAVA